MVSRGQASHAILSFNPSPHLLAGKGRFEFDHFLDVLERRAFRVAMLVVLFLWLCEKIHYTAVSTHFVDPKPQQHIEQSKTPPMASS